jgi:hypothetical protein
MSMKSDIETFLRTDLGVTQLNFDFDGFKV